MQTRFPLRARRAGALITILLLCGAAIGARATPAEDAQNWDALMMNSVKALKSNRLSDSIQLCEQAITLAHAFGPKDTHLARSQVLRAEIYMWEKDNPHAEAMFQSAVATCEQAVGPDHPEMVHPLVSLANFYYYVDVHYDRVAALFTRILGIVERTPGHDLHQEILWCRNLGLVYQQMRDFTRAEPLFARAVALAEKVDPVWLPHEELTAAAFYRAWGRTDRAEALAGRALAQREQALATTPQDVDAKLDLAVTLDELTEIHLAAAQPLAAEQTARRSLALVESFMTAEQPELVPRLAELASALQARAKYDEAAPLMQRALALAEKNLGPTSAELAPLLSQYASLLQAMKRPAAAAQMQTRAESIRQQAAANRAM